MLKKIFKSRKKVLLIGGLLVLIGLSVVCVWLKEGIKAKEDVLLKIMSEKIDLQVRDVHYTEVGDPDSIWEINADTARYAKKEDLVFFDNVRVKLIMSDGRTFVMTGKTGRLHTDTKDMEVFGNVEVTSDKGDRFTTDHLNYSSSDKKVYTDKRVTMKNPQIEISGIGMTLSMKNEKVTLLSRVNAIIR
ncbi:MAG: LPS export ABC transporter periplasmic protein LptC [Planctomycetaceae bacterium]|nr:MAG: LPS export ABC transporter periplasmic protein LptC [Planctomycetaceae bacterium]